MPIVMDARAGPEQSSFGTSPSGSVPARTPQPRSTSDASGGDRTALAATDVIAPFIAVFLAYFIAGKIGQATTSIRSSNLGPVWPAYGVALAALLTYGSRVWPAIAASAFVVALQGSVSAVAAAGQAAGATCAALTGMTLLRRIAGFDPALSRLRDALGLVVFGAFGSALVSSVIGVWSLYATGVQAYSGLPSAWLVYWLGDSTGVLLITPLLITLPRLRFESGARAVEFAALLALLTGACFLIFGDLPLFPVRLHILAFAVLPFVMWGAISFGIGGAALSVFVTASIATILTALGSGPFVGNTTFVNAILLDVLFVVLSLSGLTIAAVIEERKRAEHEREQLIREQSQIEARLHLAAIVESSADAIWSQDLDGVIVSWNAAAQRMFGFTAAEAIGHPVTILLPQGQANEDRTNLQQLQAGQRIVHREATRRTKTGELVHVSLTVSPLRDAEGRLIGVAKIARDMSEQRKARETLSAVSRRLIEAQEQERARIARELHDDISQRLALLAADLAMGSAGTADTSGQLRRKVSEIAADVQSLSHNLHSAKLELLGLAAACKRFCEEFAETQKVEIDFEARHVPPNIPADIALGIYRILQEALHNSSKHGGVSHVDVDLVATENELNLIVTDHGAGFDVATAMTSPGIGLVSMQERAKLVSGELTIESAPSRGTTIRARVPLTQPAPHE